MKPKIAVLGNQALNIGNAIAADLTLAGYEVHLFDLPRYSETIRAVQKVGGIHVSGDPQSTVSGKTGLARISAITNDHEAALKDTDVLFIDVPAHEYESRFRSIAPYIKDGAIVNFHHYGYWPSLRVAPILNSTGKENVLLTECPAPLYVARGNEGNLVFSLMRKGIPLSVFPANKSKKAFDILKAMYPSLELAENVLHTNFENINMLVHPGIALLNVAYFDRVKEHGEATAYFYGTGITEHTGILSEAQDKERKAACEAYGVPYTSLVDLINRYYDSKGKTVMESQLHSKFYPGVPAYGVDIWMQWLRTDLPLAMVPFVLLAELAGVSMPIHRSMIEIFGAILEANFWENGLSLDKLGLADLTVEEITRYVSEGRVK
jgi:opine dehydrogenase